MKERVNKFLLHLSQWIIKFRYLIVLVVIAFTVFFGYWLTKIQFDSDILNSLPDDDPVSKLYKEIGEKYGSNYMAMIILETDNVFKPEVLEHVRAITDTLELIEGVNYVTSLVNVIDIKSDSSGIYIGRLVDRYNLPQTKEELDSLKRVVFSDELYRGVLVSEDTTSTIIMAAISQDADKQAVAQEIKEKVESMNLPEKIYFTGVPIILLETNNLLIKDLATLLPIAAVIIIVILYLGFRSVRGVVLPLLNVFVAIVWTLGLMALLGYKLTLATNIIPVILLALGSAYTIHVLNRINEVQAPTIRQSVIEGLALIITPVFLAYITTAFGFISFVFGSYLVTIKQFGWFTAIGITFAFLIAITLTPSLIDIFHFKRKTEYRPDRFMIVKSFLQPMAKYVMEKPNVVIGLWILFALIFAFGFPKIERKVDMVNYYRKGNPIRVAQEVVDSKFSGTMPVFVVFRGDVQSPEFLKLMKQTEEYMKSISPYVKYTFSVADLIERMNEAMGEGKKIPDDRAKIEQLWFMLEGEQTMEQLVNYDLTEAIIQARFASLDTKIGNEFVEKMEQYAKEHSTDDIEILVTGLPSINRQLDISILRSQFYSLLIAFAFMFLIVSLTMWSWRCGLFSLIPLVATIFFSFGFMGLVHIPLDTTTVVVASITLGVGIDYAVHVISHFRKFYDELKDAKQALIETVRITGNAIIINVLAVALGFLSLEFSELSPIRNFGLLIALSMFVAGFGALTLLPAIMIKVFNHKKAE